MQPWHVWSSDNVGMARLLPGPTRLRLNTTQSCDCRIAQKERVSIDHQSTKLLSSFEECKLKIGRRLTSAPHHDSFNASRACCEAAKPRVS
ncbi:hypothetical protein VTI28DRAFT_7344 [Corynascus sepedonium]